MKKLFCVLAVASLMVLASACGNRAPKAEASECDSTEVAAADSTVAVDSVAVDSTVVAE